MAETIFLATDYGLDDEFVGVLHAVVDRMAPMLRVVDLSHGIEPFDVGGGAALLARTVPYLGEGVVCAIVDPGVGGPRRAIALERSGEGPRHLVGPDNGVLIEAALALGGTLLAVEIRRDDLDASTFEGRDLFVPAAVRLATGTPLGDLGPAIEVSSLVELATPPTRIRELDDGRVAISAGVRWIDRFGNVQLSLPGHVLAGATTAGLVVHDEDALVRVVRAFADLDRGAAGLLCDANGAVALVVAQGSASHRFHVTVGDRVELVGDFGQPS